MPIDNQSGCKIHAYETECDDIYSDFGPAICGAVPGKKSGGWALVPGDKSISRVTCPKCLRELEKRNDPIKAAAAALGRKGGSSKSPAKQAASRANGAKGGRPKKA